MPIYFLIPNGVIERGTEYDNLCQEIIDELKLLVNPNNNELAIQEIHHISDVVNGENIDELPDIVFRWKENAEIKELFHPKIGLISAPSRPRRKTQHRGNGFLIAAGKHINPNAQLSEVSALDFAPTLLYLLRENIPKYMQGRVLEELFDHQFKQNHKIEYENFSDGCNRFCR